MQTVTYNLNITPGGVPLNIHVSQYDVGLRQYTFYPFTSDGEFGYVAGATVTLEATKPDGYAVVQNCTYNSDGTIDYTLQEQLAAKAGKVWSKIVLRNGSDVIGTAAVVWIVEKAGVTDDAIVSDSDVSGIRGLIEAEVKDAIVSVLPTNSASGTVASFSDGANNIPVEDLKISIEPVQSGSGDPSPDNVRPISGWTGANVVKTGKNLLPMLTAARTHRGITYAPNVDGSIRISGTASGGQSFANITDSLILPKGNYTFSIGNNTSGFVLINGTYYNSTNGTVDFPSDGSHSATVRITVANNTSIDTTIYPMIRLSSESNSTYEPYTAQTYPISFGSAGTVYGGTLDVTTGVLTVDRAKITFTGSNYLWLKSSSYPGSFYSDTGALSPSFMGAPAGGRIICSHAKYIGQPNVGTYVYGTCALDYSVNLYLGTADMTVEQFTTWLNEQYIAGTPVEICGKIRTPITYQLTPTEVRTLLGINNIYADTGDTEVAYRADTTRYIDRRIDTQQKLISGVETSYTATKNYAIGDYVIVADTLYKVTAAIATGATITPGTNATATTVAEQLILLANA